VSCQPIDDDDVDVACERRRVLRGDADGDMLKIENLTKVRVHFPAERGEKRLLMYTYTCIVSLCV